MHASALMQPLDPPAGVGLHFTTVHVELHVHDPNCCLTGVALDDLVYICTKIARQMDADGLSKVFDAAETASSAIEEARPLLENAVKLVDEVSCFPPLPSCRLMVSCESVHAISLCVENLWLARIPVTSMPC